MCNSDGVTKGSLGLYACGRISRDCNASTLGCFCHRLGVQKTLYVELIRAIMAIEITFTSMISKHDFNSSSSIETIQVCVNNSQTLK